MSILRVADEKSIPWFMTEEQKSSVQAEEVESINIAEEVDEAVLAQECDRIEACSSNGKPYHYNANWDAGVVRHLREYAIACGMDLEKFRGFDPSGIQKESAAEESMVRTASTKSSATAALKGVWKDPFRIDERSDTSHMNAANWEQVKKAEVLDPASIMTGTIIPLGGGENYFLNSDVNPASNQNSITNPDAIKQLAESKKLDNGERLKQQAKAKEEQKKQEHATWQKEKIAAMANGDIIPKGTVFPTETLNAHTGLNHAPIHGGVYSSKKQSMPAKTEGEKIAENNAARKASIQRPKETDNWQKPCKQSSRFISDVFASSLAKQLNK